VSGADPAGAAGPDRPNILFIVSDQERQRGWLPPDVELPNRQRLIDSGLEFTNYFTHSSPCSPSRATIFTGQYVPQHGVNENVVFPYHRPLDPAIPTIGQALREQGYATSYLGKWHLDLGPSPDMEAYGFSDWKGNDLHFMGWAGTGAEFDPVIAQQAADWLGMHARQREPWCLTVGLVNPHDVMWFPIDQPAWQEAHPEETELAKAILGYAAWKESDPIPTYDRAYPEHFDALPANFDDDLFTKPAVQRQWQHEQQHAIYGHIDHADTGSWLRQLDYYVDLHRQGDRNLGVILDALEASGRWDDTAIVFTSDHGDMCGSHGLRSKGPFVYDEIMRIPLYVKAPGITQPGTRTDALASHVDLATTIPMLGGAAREEIPTFQGHDLRPVLTDPSASVRDHILFAQDTAWYERCIPLRYAIRGVFDGRHKYARYYGVGGGTSPTTGPPKGPKLFDVDAAFEDQDHELYDLADDPHELVNLANDRGRRHEVREWFGRLAELEAKAGI
jgi:arylsulfatase A-like enzyme